MAAVAARPPASVARFFANFSWHSAFHSQPLPLRMADDSTLYRLALKSEIPDDAWRTRLQWVTAYAGISGLDDGFVHMSATAEQVAETAQASFAGKDNVMLLQFSSTSMREEADLDIRMEDGFPHVYGGPVPFACLVSPPELLALGPDGKHVLTQLGLGSNGETNVGRGHRLEDEEDHYISSDDDYDGCGATGMYG